MQKNQKINILFETFIILLFFFLSIQYAFSQSPLLSEGGVDTHLYKSDTVILESTAMEDGTGQMPSGVLSAGLSMLHSPYLTIFYIPLKYGLNDNFNISFSLPYLTKTLVFDDTHYIKSGYGDTMLGFTGAFQPFSIFTTNTTARITLPTGNVNAQDFDYYIPMGYGGYTASIQESISIGKFDVIFFSVRFFISGLGIYYFESEQKIDQVEKNTYNNTYAWSAMGGLELNITENLAMQIKGNYININERKYENNTAPGIKMDANDSIKQINILPFIKYRFTDEISGQCGIIYPIKSTQDKDITDPYDAKWKFIFGIEKKFSNCVCNSSESVDIKKTRAYEKVKSWESSNTNELEKNVEPEESIKRTTNNKSVDSSTSKKKRKKRR